MFYKRLAKMMLKISLFAFILLISITAQSHQVVEGCRVSAAPDNIRVVLDLSGKVKYKVFSLENPNRVVIDIDDAKIKSKLDTSSIQNTAVKQMRHSLNKGKLRIVLDLEDVVYPSDFMVTPQQGNAYRLVVDLKREPFTKVSAILAPQTTARSQSQPQPQPQPKPMAIPKIQKVEANHPTRDFIVAIDPGHGGEDTGAIGRNFRLKEKDVVFAVSTKLQRMINAQRGMRAYLIRSGDYYVGLRERMALAREQGADLFISVHADSFKDQKASGASVFVLSEKGASNEAARWLAEKENRSDLVGGVKLEDKGDLLASVLIDLSQTASQTASYELASDLIANLAKVTNLHHKTVQSAGFMVLKSPDIPSVLVELGFISNKRQEEKLLNAAYQQALAGALFSGVKVFMAKRPPPIAHPHDINVATR